MQERQYQMKTVHYQVLIMGLITVLICLSSYPVKSSPLPQTCGDYGYISCNSSSGGTPTAANMNCKNCKYRMFERYNSSYKNVFAAMILFGFSWQMFSKTEKQSTQQRRNNVYQLEFSITYYSNIDLHEPKDSIPQKIAAVLAESLSSKVKVQSFEHNNMGMLEYCMKFIFQISGCHENLYKLSADETQELVKSLKFVLKEEMDFMTCYISYWHYQNLDYDQMRMKDLSNIEIDRIGKDFKQLWKSFAFDLNWIDLELENSSRFAELMVRQEGTYAGECLSLLQKRYPLLTAADLVNIIGGENVSVHIGNTRIKNLSTSEKLKLLVVLNLEQCKESNKALFWENILKGFEKISYDELERNVKKRNKLMSNPGAELISILKYHQPEMLLKSYLQKVENLVKTKSAI